MHRGLTLQICRMLQDFVLFSPKSWKMPNCISTLAIIWAAPIMCENVLENTQPQKRRSQELIHPQLPSSNTPFGQNNDKRVSTKTQSLSLNIRMMNCVSKVKYKCVSLFAALCTVCFCVDQNDKLWAKGWDDGIWCRATKGTSRSIWSSFRLVLCFFK